jgi:TonB family protein
MVRILRAFVLSLAALAAGCSSLVKNPPAAEAAPPLAHAHDERVKVTLERVLVRNAKEAWVRDADWDEYRVRVGAYGGTIEVRAITLVDVTDTPVQPSSDREALVEGSRAAESRYRAAIAVGMASTGVGVGGAAALWPLYMGAPAAVILAAPAIVGGLVYGGVGINRMVDRANVAEQIRLRASALPVAVAHGQEATLTLFYPRSPLPSRLEIAYAHAAADRVVAMDLREALAKAHFEPEPWAILRQQPMFPIAATREGIRQGRVRARLTVNPNGWVAGVKILESEPPGVFDREAIATFKLWRYNASAITRDTREVEDTMVFER